ncbi:MAG: hypothetical protein JXA13_07275 [Anaerolineales bacterium]|nr:hypothetical protein [Anaerolineales bacterium]
MVTLSDFIRIPYTPDLTRGGIVYAGRSLFHTFTPTRSKPFDRMRHTVARTAVELAFRRYLSEQEIPFDVLQMAPLCEPDRYDVSIGGHHCDLSTYLITSSKQTNKLQHTLKPLLDAPALIPSEKFAASSPRGSDLYLFAFTIARKAAAKEELQKAIEAGQPTHLVYIMPAYWIRPMNWQSLGDLVLKSETDHPVTLELSGQNQERDFHTDTITLPPQTRVKLQSDFFSLASLHINQPVSARIGIHSSQLKETILINPHEWGNIWMYGNEIILTGYLSQEEFRRKAAQLQPGSRVYQYTQTRVKNLSLPVRELRPLGPLLTRIKSWEIGQVE